MRHIIIATALALSVAACGPDMKGLEKGETGTVSEIIDGDTIQLDNGLRVTLTGVEAPYGDAAYAGEARALLEELAKGRPARLAYGGLRRMAPRRQPVAAPETPEGEPNPALDSGGTALAQVFVQSEGGRWIWLQQAMVLRGGAWARPRRQNMARSDELLAAEARAREGKAGLWALADYSVRTPAAIEKEALPSIGCGRGPFRVVEGVVRDVAVQEDRVYFNFGEDYRTDFTVAIYGDDVKDWAGPPFDTYKGKRVLARGRAIARGGPLICADNPGQLELVER